MFATILLIQYYPLIRCENDMNGDGDHGDGDLGFGDDGFGDPGNGGGDDEDEGHLQQYFSPAGGPALKAQPHHRKLHTRL